MNNTTTTTKPSKYDEVLANTVAKILEGLDTTNPGDWTAPWHRTGAGHVFAPFNATTGRHYTGGNVGLLAVEAMIRGYSGGAWATYKQWASIDRQVQKGEKGTKAVRWVAIEREDEETGEIKTRMVPKIFTVFHEAQVEADPKAAPLPCPEYDDSHDEWIEGLDCAPVSHDGGDRAYYSPMMDSIHLPQREAFTSPEGYYSTRCHEAAHSTGHADRLDRAEGMKARFGTEAYAMEELVAELSAAILLAKRGISSEPRPDHAQYIGSWARLLDDDARNFWHAVSQATKAVAHLLGEDGTE